MPTIKFPPDARVAVIAGHWDRDLEGNIVATYTDEEAHIIFAALAVSEKRRKAREMAAEREEQKVVVETMKKFAPDPKRTSF